MKKLKTRCSFLKRHVVPVSLCTGFLFLGTVASAVTTQDCVNWIQKQYPDEAQRVLSATVGPLLERQGELFHECVQKISRSHEGKPATDASTGLTVDELRDFHEKLNYIKNYDKTHSLSDQNSKSENLKIKVGIDLIESDRLYANAKYIRNHWNSKAGFQAEKSNKEALDRWALEKAKAADFKKMPEEFMMAAANTLEAAFGEGYGAGGHAMIAVTDKMFNTDFKAELETAFNVGKAVFKKLAEVRETYAKATFKTKLEAEFNKKNTKFNKGAAEFETAFNKMKGEFEAAFNKGFLSGFQRALEVTAVGLESKASKASSEALQHMQELEKLNQKDSKRR